MMRLINMLKKVLKRYANGDAGDGDDDSIQKRKDEASRGYSPPMTE